MDISSPSFPEIRAEFITSQTTREDIQKNKNTLFIYGDNDQRTGLGGAAKVARGEPNSIGIRTKKLPSLNNNAFYTDSELETNKKKIREDIQTTLKTSKRYSKIKIFPLGEGLASLKEKAPLTYVFLQKEIQQNFFELKKEPSQSLFDEIKEKTTIYNGHNKEKLKNKKILLDKNKKKEQNAKAFSSFFEKAEYKSIKSFRIMKIIVKVMKETQKNPSYLQFKSENQAQSYIDSNLQKFCAKPNETRLLIDNGKLAEEIEKENIPLKSIINVKESKYDENIFFNSSKERGTEFVKIQNKEKTNPGLIAEGSKSIVDQYLKTASKEFESVTARSLDKTKDKKEIIAYQKNQAIARVKNDATLEDFKNKIGACLSAYGLVDPTKNKFIVIGKETGKDYMDNQNVYAMNSSAIQGTKNILDQHKKDNKDTKINYEVKGAFTNTVLFASGYRKRPNMINYVKSGSEVKQQMDKAIKFLNPPKAAQQEVVKTNQTQRTK